MKNMLILVLVLAFIAAFSFYAYNSLTTPYNINVTPSPKPLTWETKYSIGSETIDEFRAYDFKDLHMKIKTPKRMSEINSVGDYPRYSDFFNQQADEIGDNSNMFGIELSIWDMTALNRVSSLIKPTERKVTLNGFPAEIYDNKMDRAPCNEIHVFRNSLGANVGFSICYRTSRVYGYTDVTPPLYIVEIYGELIEKITSTIEIY
jgi:hypothetical protein